MRRSQLPPNRALEQFLNQFRRTPTSCGYPPDKLLNAHQLPSTVGSLQQLPTCTAQGKQAHQRTKSKNKESATCATINQNYQVSDVVYTEHLGSGRNTQPRRTPAVSTKRLGNRSVNIRILSRGPVWREQLAQLRPRCSGEEDSSSRETAVSDSSLSQRPADHPTDVLTETCHAERERTSHTIP